MFPCQVSMVISFRESRVRHMYIKGRHMNFSSILHQGFPIVALAVVFLLLASACQSAATPTVAPTPTPTATPVPTPTPAETFEGIVAKVGEKMAAMSSAKFTMVDETESGALFFGTKFKSLEGELEAPSSVNMVVDVEAPGLGFVEIGILAVGEQAFMKFSKDAPWTPLPLSQVPFDFGGIGVAVSELLPLVENGVITGRVSLRGRPGYPAGRQHHVRGNEEANHVGAFRSLNHVDTVG